MKLIIVYLCLTMSYKDHLFESSQGDDCLLCTETTKYYLDCCQKPVCPSCFQRWHFEGKLEHGQCCHCRSVLFVPDQKKEVFLVPEDQIRELFELIVCFI